MKKLSILKKAKEFVQQSLSGEGTGHDWWHIERVLNNARLINKNEKASNFIIELAVLLHDVGDHKVIHKVEDDYSIAENFLIGENVDVEIIEKVMFIIKNMSFSKTLNNKLDNISKEFCVVQDADRLDGIGAIGIARVFAYGGSKNRPLFDPTIEPKKIDSIDDYKKLKTSSFHHFGEKLLLLKDLMNTKTAKKIAQKRHDYMKKYMEQFMAEWKGVK